MRILVSCEIMHGLNLFSFSYGLPRMSALLQRTKHRSSVKNENGPLIPAVLVNVIFVRIASVIGDRPRHAAGDAHVLPSPSCQKRGKAAPASSIAFPKQTHPDDAISTTALTTTSTTVVFSLAGAAAAAAATSRVNSHGTCTD